MALRGRWEKPLGPGRCLLLPGGGGRADIVFHSLRERDRYCGTEGVSPSLFKRVCVECRNQRSHQAACSQLFETGSRPSVSGNSQSFFPARPAASGASAQAAEVPVPRPDNGEGDDGDDSEQEEVESEEAGESLPNVSEVLGSNADEYISAHVTRSRKLLPSSNSIRFPFPSPACLNWNDSRKLNPFAAFFSHGDLFLWDPEQAFKEHFDLNVVPCPFCKQRGVLRRKGYSPVNRLILRADATPSVLNSVQYEHFRCPECKPGRKSRYCLSSSTEFLSGLSPVVLCEFPAILSKKCAVSPGFSTLVRALKQEGRVPLSGIESLLEEVATTELLEAEKYALFLRCELTSATEASSAPGAQPRAVPLPTLPPLLSLTGLPKLVSSVLLGRKLVRTLYQHEAQRLEGFAQSSLVRACREARGIKADHTFYITLHGVKERTRSQDGVWKMQPVADAVFTVMNHLGYLMHIQFVSSKSVAARAGELRKMQQLAGGNPRIDCRAFRESLGSDTMVLGDIFHAEKGYFEGCKAKYREKRKIFMGQVALAFLVFEEQDVKAFVVRETERRLQFLKTTQPSLAPEQARKLAKELAEKAGTSASKLASSVEVRRGVRERADIIQRLKAAVDHFDALDLFHSSLKSHHREVLAQIEAGHFDTPDTSDMPEHVNIGTQQSPRFIHCRSTSQLESAHRWLRPLFTAGSEPFLAHDVTLDASLRFNMKKDILFATASGASPLFCFDPELLNRVKRLLGPALSLSHPLSSWSLLDPLPTDHPDRVNVGVVASDRSSVAAASFSLFVESSDRASELSAKLEGLSNRHKGDINWRGEGNNLPTSVTPVTSEAEAIFLSHLARLDREGRQGGSVRPRSLESADHFVKWHDVEAITRRYNSMWLEAVASGQMLTAQSYSYRVVPPDSEPTPDRETHQLDPAHMHLKEVCHVREFLQSKGEAWLTALAISPSATERERAKRARVESLTDTICPPGEEQPLPPRLPFTLPSPAPVQPHVFLTARDASVTERESSPSPSRSLSLSLALPLHSYRYRYWHLLPDLPPYLLPYPLPDRYLLLCQVVMWCAVRSATVGNTGTLQFKPCNVQSLRSR